MSKSVLILDYGVGNILSVAHAFEHCGANVDVSGHWKDIRKADFLILPGVGAFASAMKGLKNQGLDRAIQDFVRTERPFLGICLGMQLMFQWSTEMGRHKGLGLLDGHVVQIEKTGLDGTPHKVPHVGWSPLEPPSGAGKWHETIMRQTKPGTAFYFVHSFKAVSTAPNNCIAVTYYDGREISALVRKNNLYGCQFHPEKSGSEGLKIIDQFLRL